MKDYLTRVGNSFLFLKEGWELELLDYASENKLTYEEKEYLIADVLDFAKLISDLGDYTLVIVEPKAELLAKQLNIRKKDAERVIDFIRGFISWADGDWLFDMGEFISIRTNVYDYKIESRPHPALSGKTDDNPYFVLTNVAGDDSNEQRLLLF